jgi:hypothetical protein
MKRPLIVGRATALADLTDTYEFFTPAILYVLGIVTDLPLIDFLEEYGQPAHFYFKQFTCPLFAGLDVDNDPGWNYGLWAIEKQHWPSFLDFYCSIKVSNRSSKRMFGIGVQNVTVVDALAIASKQFLKHLPTISVAGFGVNSNILRAAFVRGGSNPLTHPPTLKYFTPDKSATIFADAYYAGKNPHIAQETYNASQGHKTG